MRDATVFKVALFVLALVAGAGLGAAAPKFGESMTLPGDGRSSTHVTSPPTLPSPPPPRPTTSSSSSSSGADAAGGPRTIEILGDSSATSVGTPCSGADGASCPYGFERSAMFTLEQGSPTRATLAATWKASTPLASVLTVSFSAGASSKGPSPQILEIPVAKLHDAGSYFAAAAPDAPGVMLGDSVHYVLTLEYS